MRVRLLGAATLAAVSVLAFSSCSLLFKLKADKVIVLTWLQAPTLDTPPFNQIPDLGMVTATAFFAKDGIKATPVSGGFAAFFGGGQQFFMTERNPDGAPGIYIATSLDDPDKILPYDSDPNRRFGLKACLDNVQDVGCVGEEFQLLRVRAAPPVDKTTLTFDPPLQTPDSPLFDGFDGAIDAGTDLTVVFPAPTDEFRYHAIVSVFGPTSSGVPGLVFNSLPLQGPELVKFITEDPPLRITIPGDKLTAGGPYLVLAATARINTDSSDNVLIGAAIAGAMSAFLVEVKGNVTLPGGFMLPVALPGGLPNIPGGFQIPSNLPTSIPGNIPGAP